jgi:hypothetical protein
MRFSIRLFAWLLPLALAGAPPPGSVPLFPQEPYQSLAGRNQLVLTDLDDDEIKP